MINIAKVVLKTFVFSFLSFCILFTNNSFAQSVCSNASIDYIKGFGITSFGSLSTLSASPTTNLTSIAGRYFGVVPYLNYPYGNTLPGTGVADPILSDDENPFLLLRNTDDGSTIVDLPVSGAYAFGGGNREAFTQTEYSPSGDALYILGGQETHPLNISSALQANLLVNFLPGQLPVYLAAPYSQGKEQFFMKHSTTTGNLEWVRQLRFLGAVNQSLSLSARMIADTNAIYLVGEFRGVVDFDNTVNSLGIQNDDIRTSAGSDLKVFVTKYNSDGTYGGTYIPPTVVGTIYSLYTGTIINNKLFVGFIIPSFGNTSTYNFGATLTAPISLAPGTSATALLVFDLNTMIVEKAVAVGVGPFNCGISKIQKDSLGNLILVGDFIGTCNFTPAGLGLPAYNLTTPGNNASFQMITLLPYYNLYLDHDMFIGEYSSTTLNPINVTNLGLGGENIGIPYLRMQVVVNNCGDKILFSSYQTDASTGALPTGLTPSVGTFQDMFIYHQSPNGASCFISGGIPLLNEQVVSAARTYNGKIMFLTAEGEVNPLPPYNSGNFYGQISGLASCSNP